MRHVDAGSHQRCPSLVTRRCQHAIVVLLLTQGLDIACLFVVLLSAPLSSGTKKARQLLPQRGIDRRQAAVRILGFQLSTATGN